MSDSKAHSAIFKRLKRAEGHIRAVQHMLEEGRSCLDIAQQLAAVEAAIIAAKKEFIHEHIQNCLALDTAAGQNAALQNEMKQIAKYL